MARYRYYWKMGALGRISIQPAKRTKWDNRRGDVAKATPRVTVQFENHVWETDDEALARGMEQNVEFKRGRITPLGASPAGKAKVATGMGGAPTSLAAIVALVERLPGLPPAPDDDVPWGAFRMPELLEVA